MITVWIADNEQRLKDILLEMLQKEGNINLYITKERNVVKIARKEDIKELVRLEDKIIELEESLCRQKKGAVYRFILQAIEKPLFEHILEYTEGNQLKAARILGINRNTMRAKIKKLDIDVNKWKIK